MYFEYIYYSLFQIISGTKLENSKPHAAKFMHEYF